MMKTKKIKSPTSNDILKTLTIAPLASAMYLHLENINDLAKVPSELKSFIANDLSRHSILIVKHR
jgi:uncharacterized protein YcgL (UPF0745 family)